jgi:hypothetical protein
MVRIIKSNQSDKVCHTFLFHYTQSPSIILFRYFGC